MSTETNQDRLVPSGRDEFQDQNMYIHNTANPKDILQKDLNTYYFYAFYLDILIFITLFVLFIVILVILIKKLINRPKTVSRKKRSMRR